MAELISTIEAPTERLGARIKRSVGRNALRFTAIIAGAGAVLGVGSTVEHVTGHEARAEAGGGVNGAEKAWCRWPSRFALCIEADHLAQRALTAAEGVAEKTGWSLEDGGADAVRHCYWNALMTKSMDRPTASGFAWRHEYNDAFGSDASKMDLHNNLKGRDWANAEDPLQRCVEGVRSGELVTIQ
jgi:hypothetical protein